MFGMFIRTNKNFVHSIYLLYVYVNYQVKMEISSPKICLVLAAPTSSLFDIKRNVLDIRDFLSISTFFSFGL